MSYRYKIRALNEVCARVGGTTGHRQSVRALNEWARQLGGAGTHARNVRALNEICGRLGGSGGHARNVAALNEICARLGGVGGHATTMAALNEILARLPATGAGEAPQITGVPEIVGAGEVGTIQGITGYALTGSPAPDLTLVWRVDGTEAGTGPSYLPAPTDEGRVLSCVLTATNHAGTAAATTAGVVITRTISIRDRYEELNGGLPTYAHPDETYLGAAAGTFATAAAWTFPNNPGGNMGVSGGALSIPANSALRLARTTLEMPAAAGQAFDVMCRRVSGTGGNLAMKLQGAGNNATGGSGQNGWLSAPITPTANRATLDVQITGNFAATVDNVSVRLQALATRKFHVISFAGQSNMVGASAGSCDPDIDGPHPRIWMMPGGSSSGYLQAAGAITQAHAPIQHRSFNAGIGPDLSFARYYADHYLPADCDLLMLACARGGTSLNPASGTWHPAGTNRGDYEACVADVLAALALNPANRYVAHVWCQGESDRGATGASNYLAWFPAYVAAHRADTGTDVPVVVIGLNPAAETGDGSTLAMIAAQESLAEGGANGIAGVVYSGWRLFWGDGTKDAPDDTADRVHFGPWANRLRGVQAAIDAAPAL